MPDNRQGGNASGGVSGSPAAEKIEESMWRLKIQENQEEGDDGVNPYPDRPGEPDCIYYLRTGVCGYGSNCRYNHPSFTGQGSRYRAELPERVGQPDCLYFLKTGTCKFGATCKYHHPREQRDNGQVMLNILGLPIRPNEKPCQYYMRTGSCKYGVACKFNHPPPAPVGAMLPMSGLSVYGAGGSSIASPSGTPVVGGLPSWSLPRPTYMPNSTRVQSPAYMPLVVPSSQGLFSGQHGWASYPSAISPVPSPDSLGHGQTSNAKSHTVFPERPDQPDCQYYMKTGNCKYGSSCKYNHPKGRITLPDSYTIGPHGLPLRLGQAACTFYTTYGTCKYGLACKYDHPIGYYAVSAIPIGDPSALYPYQRSSPSAVSWVPSDTPPVRTLKLPDSLKKSDSPGVNVENMDASASEDPPPQDSPSQTAPSSGSPQEQSD